MASTSKRRAPQKRKEKARRYFDRPEAKPVTYTNAILVARREAAVRAVWRRRHRF